MNEGNITEVEGCNHFDETLGRQMDPDIDTT